LCEAVSTTGVAVESTQHVSAVVTAVLSVVVVSVVVVLVQDTAAMVTSTMMIHSFFMLQ
jgi:hypothetical protein